MGKDEKVASIPSRFDKDYKSVYFRGALKFKPKVHKVTTPGHIIISLQPNDKVKSL